jgi:hypothetical protein
MSSYLNKQIVVYTFKGFGKLVTGTLWTFAAAALIICACGEMVWILNSVFVDKNIWTMVGIVVVIFIGCWFYAIDRYDTEQIRKERDAK